MFKACSQLRPAREIVADIPGVSAEPEKHMVRNKMSREARGGVVAQKISRSFSDRVSTEVGHREVRNSSKAIWWISSGFLT